MADPTAGAAIGFLFAEFYSGACKLIKNYIEFEPLLGDLEKTLAALNPLIKNIIFQNRTLHLPNQVAENLKEDIEEGLKLVRKYSEAGAVVRCLKKPTTYTTQIRKLDVSLRRQLEILKVYEVLVANATHSLVTLVAEKLEIIPKDRQPNYRNDLVSYPMEIEESSLPVLMNNENDAVLGEVQSTTASTMSSGPVDVFRGAGGGIPKALSLPVNNVETTINRIEINPMTLVYAGMFAVLYDMLKELINKSFIYKPLFKNILSELDSFAPLIKHIEASNEDLGLPEEEVENFNLQLKKGIEIVEKCSKVSKWNIYKKCKYANRLLGLGCALRRHLDTLIVQEIRDVKNYALPEFVYKMEKLKVLVVINYGFVPSEITNFQLLRSASNLKTIRLERISISSITKNRIELKSLQKISLFMCNIGQAFRFNQLSHAFPNLVEVNIDYCNDLVDLPADICDLIHMKKISITNCHKLLALPEEIGKLANLEVLRLRSCTDLEKLPGSIWNLKKLSFLDISYCFSIKELPEDIGEMSSLRKLNMRECSRLQEVPLSVLDLNHLMEVVCDDETKSLWDLFLPLENTRIVVAKKIFNLNWLHTRKATENLDTFTEEVGTSEVKERSDSSTEEVVSGIEAQFGIQNQSETEAGRELPQPIVELDVPLEELQREIVKDDCCSDDAEFAALPNDEVLVPMQIASPLKIPTLRTVFPLHLLQPENKKKRLAQKSHVSSSDEPTLPPEHNSSTDHSRHMSSANSTISIELCQEDSSSIVDGQVRKHILPVDLERYEKENSSHLSRVGMQDMYLAMQRFHVMSTRLVQSEERVALLETNYQKAEESWKLEHRKLSEQYNSAMAQVASLTKEKDSLAERITLLEKNKVTGRQEAQEILKNECVPEFRRQMQDAEKECFELGCRVGFKSFLAKVENKFPNLYLSDISHFEPIGFDLKVIEELLGPDHDNEADNSDEQNGNDEERGGKSLAAEVPEDVLELLYHYAVDNMIDGTTIIVNMEEEVLGVAKPIYILREDVMQFIEMTPISATCINVYMRHLYDVLKQSNKDGMVRSCDASSISVGKPYEKSQVLATRLQQLSTNQILLVPYNSGNHWILTIMNEEKDICYFMDPIHSLRDPLEWISIVNNGIKQWNHHTGRGLHKSPVWKILKGPKQPSTVECGYYVMRYMKEMVENISLSFAKKWDSKKYFSAYKETERAYTKREIDEVQWEWASLVYQQKRRGLRMAGSG